MKIGLSTNIFQYDSIEKAIIKLADFKPGCLEIVFEIPHFPPRMRGKIDPAKIRKIVDSYKIELSVHSCFFELNLGSSYPVIRKLTLEQIKKCIEFSSCVDAKLLTIHPGYFPLIENKKLRLYARRRFTEDLKECLNYALKEGVPLSVENIHSPHFFLSRLEDLAGLVGKIKGLGITLDIAHAYILKREEGVGSPEEEIAEEVKTILRNRILHLHIHDNFGVKDSHLIPGDGRINFKPVVQALREIDYDGQIIVEAWNPKNPFNTGRRALEAAKNLFCR